MALAASLALRLKKSFNVIDYRVQTKINVVAGWGRTIGTDTNNTEGFTTSDAYEQHLQKLQLDDIFEGPYCAQKFKGLEKRGVGNQRILCARAKYEANVPKDTCSGDAGGPLFSSAGQKNQSDMRYLRGISSFGSTKCGIVSDEIKVDFSFKAVKNSNLFSVILQLIPIRSTDPYFGYNSGDPHYGYIPSVFTKVEEFIPWILENIKP